MLQVLLNSLVYASMIAVIAVGVALCYSILRFANFAHIQFAVVGGYLTYSFAAIPGMPLPAALALSAVATGLIAILVDFLVFSRLRDITPEGKMIVSWGVALFLRSVVAIIYGGGARVFDLSYDVVAVGDAVFTTLDALVVVVAAVLMLLLHLFLNFTRVGSGLRALASNADLAVTRGIPGDRLIKLMWFLSGALAAIGGTLLAFETRLQPNMDLIILLPVFAAVTIGGLSNVFGAVLGALILSLAQNLLIYIDFGALLGGESWQIPTQFRDYVAVLALVVVLLLRPRLSPLAGR
ncbi:branched-chain amino acid ABC transporter permease [Ancylobacter defluvii]|uniref:Branched-chain amino acid ABC transporter permease n=1 Tax=Ancylobacter defluvii TaxID=1282440 RepID=A0A9W6JVY5_9HYPH|nr:branched-chain amino acid ABC transporter permease [Ancylobacter defluvii]MBS7585779.1 branched-chain amino acid ABC transporter permease [Ancylobacter defluvii]GLK84152.1 branched-chain amino acid ABC transporter permease [Ancylobacter defluvii]